VNGVVQSSARIIATFFSVFFSFRIVCETPRLNDLISVGCVENFDPTGLLKIKREGTV